MNNDKIFSLKNQTIFLHTPPYSVDICRVREKNLTGSKYYIQTIQTDGGHSLLRALLDTLDDALLTSFYLNYLSSPGMLLHLITST